MSSTTPRQGADAYQTLRDEIMSGQLAPNERLVEQDLVARYGLSRGAVRIALVRLEQDRVVVHERNRGARVRRVSEAEAVEILDARSALEGLAAGYAARRATDAEIRELVTIAMQMAELQRGGDLVAMSDRNAQLHGMILQMSRHETIQRLAGELKSQMVRFQYRTILAAGRPAQSLAEHSAIVDAIVDRDSDGAERAMRTHLSNVARALHERVVAEVPGASEPAA